MYAKWISEELLCTAVPYEELKEVKISEYDLIIFGSRIHAGKVDGFRKFKRQLEGNTTKLIVFATGATPAKAKDVIDKIWKSSFSKEELSEIPHFYMQTGLNYERMGAGDRLIMKALAKVLRNKKEKDSEEKGCEQAIKNSYDISSREFITPLIDYIGNNKIFQ